MNNQFENKFLDFTNKFFHNKRAVINLLFVLISFVVATFLSWNKLDILILGMIITFIFYPLGSLACGRLSIIFFTIGLFMIFIKFVTYAEVVIVFGFYFLAFSVFMSLLEYKLNSKGK